MINKSWSWENLHYQLIYAEKNRNILLSLYCMIKKRGSKIIQQGTECWVPSGAERFKMNLDIVSRAHRGRVI